MFNAKRILAAGLGAVTMGCALGQVVPVRMVDGLPVLRGHVGSAAVSFVLDTGGQATFTLPARFASSKLGVVELDSTATMTDLTGRVFHPRKLRARHIGVGKVELGPLTGLRHYAWGAGSERPAVTRNGIIGLEAFGGRTVDFDLGHARLVVHDRDRPVPAPPANAREFALAYDDVGIRVGVDVAGRSLQFVLDSAATGSFVSSTAPAFAAADVPCRDASEKPEDCARRFTFVGAGVDISDLDIYANDAEGMPFEGLLGIDYFQRNWIRVDFVNRRLLIAHVDK